MTRLILLFLLIFASLSTSAHHGHQNYSKFDYIILIDSTSVHVEPTGSGAFNIVKSIKIQTPKGAVENRIIVYDYDPLTAFAKFKTVSILRASGKVEELDMKNAYDYAAPARAIYWGARQIMFDVGQLNPGDIVNYEIEKSGFTYALLANSSNGATSGGGGGATSPSASGDDDSRFIPPMKGEFYDIVPFWASAPTINKVYRLSIPMEKEIQFKFYQGECASSMVYENGRKVYTFSKTNMFPFKSETNMVSLFDAAPKLFLSSTPDWVKKSLWFHNVNEEYGSFNAYAPAQKMVDKIIKGKDTEMEKIAALTHWVADNIRYVGLSMGEGEGFTLHSTEMNFTDRGGVCKDIAGMLISFLRMAGFEAYPAMTMAGSRVEKIPADHFNHCVTVVKLSSGIYIPLDPTWVPFSRELWSSKEQQQNYLPGTPEGSDLQITPISASENHYFRIKANSVLAENGTLKGEFTVSAEGISDAVIRGVFTRGWMSDWQNTMEKQLLAISPKAKMLSVNYGKNPKDYQAEPISITFKYIIPNYAIVGEDELVFKFVSMNNIYNSVRTFNNLNTKATEKKYGFKDSCSRLVEFEESVTIPAGYNLVGEAIEDSMKSQFSEFEGNISQKGNKLKLTQKLALEKREYLPGDWEGFRSAVLKHKAFGDYVIIKNNK